MVKMVEPDNDDVEVDKDCGSCNGSGQCQSCDGNDEGCTYCDGSGDCDKCDGSGTEQIMSTNGDSPNEPLRVTHLLDIRKEQLDLANQTEFHLMKALWDLRGAFRVEDMVTWTGWSRQTIYNKWDKHGLRKIRNAQSRRDN